MEKIGELELNKVHCMDCLEGMKLLPDNSVDLVVTYPPYYRIKNDKWDNQWDTFEAYLNWVEEFSLEIKRVLKDNGSYYIFGDDERIAYIQVKLDNHFTYLNHLVWYKTNNMPIKYAHNHRKFCPMSERILFYCQKNGKCSWDKTGLEYVEEKYIKPRNPMAIYLKEEIERSGKSRKELASIFLSKTGNLTGCVSNWINGDNFPLEEQYLKIKEFLGEGFLLKDYEHLRKDYEHLRKDYEHLRRPYNYQKGVHEIIIEPIIQEKENTLHSTTKPIRLISKLIKASSNKGDVVLDLFMGSGTTAISAKQLNRNFIGFEIDKEYVKIINKRLQQSTVESYFKNDIRRNKRGKVCS